MSACSHPPSPPPLPEQNTRLVYPPMPPTKCAREPVAPAVDADDRDWSAYKRAKDDAGADCRDKLDEVDRTVTKWPKPPPN